MRLLFRAVVGFVVLLVGAVLAFLYVPAIGSHSTKALAYSVGRKLNGDATCHRQGRSRFDCTVTHGSGGDEFRVNVRGDCWTARRKVGNEFPKRRRGCVRWRDQLRLFDRLVGAI